MRRVTASIIVPTVVFALLAPAAAAMASDPPTSDAPTSSPPAATPFTPSAVPAPEAPSRTASITATPASGTHAAPGEAAAPVSSAQEPASTDLPPLDEYRTWDGFHFDLTAGAWFARVTGDVSADSPIKYDLADDLGLSSQEVSFAGDLEARWRSLHFRFSGSEFRTSGGNTSTAANVLNGVIVRAGDPTASSLSMWNAGGDVGIDLFRLNADNRRTLAVVDEQGRTTEQVTHRGLGGAGGYAADMRLGAFFGARAFNTDLDFANLRTGRSTTLDQTWTAVYVGGRVTIDLWLRDHFPILERMSVDADASFGPAYPGSGSYFQVRAGITVFPCDNFGLQFGYRLQKIHGDGSGQDLDANFAGLFLGGALHF